MVTMGPANERDLDVIQALERDGFEHGWSREAWADELSSPFRLVLLAKAGTRPVGVISCQVIDDTAELMRVIVAVTERGRGLGRQLCRAGMGWAKDCGARRMLLEVEATNEPALALYRGLGFAEIHRRDDYYGAGRAALILEVAL